MSVRFRQELAEQVLKSKIGKQGASEQKPVRLKMALLKSARELNCNGAWKFNRRPSSAEVSRAFSRTISADPLLSRLVTAHTEDSRELSAESISQLISAIAPDNNALRRFTGNFLEHLATMLGV